MTLIYSDGEGKTADILVEWGTKYALEQKERVVLFPEGNLHPEKQIPLFEELLKEGGVVITHSEVILLRYMQLLRTREIAPSVKVEVLQLCTSRNAPENPPFFKRIKVDEEGDMLTHWRGGFFETTFRMMFGDI